MRKEKRITQWRIAPYPDRVGIPVSKLSVGTHLFEIVPLFVLHIFSHVNNKTHPIRCVKRTSRSPHDMKRYWIFVVLTLWRSELAGFSKYVRSGAA